MLFILCVFTILLPLSLSNSIPDYIWDSPELDSYELCQKTFRSHAAWDAAERDVPTRSAIPHLKGGSNVLTWPSGRVPYWLSKTIVLSDYLMKRLACAMLLFHTKTCVRFAPKTRNDRNYLFITYDQMDGCFSSSIGMKPNYDPVTQQVNLGTGCWKHGKIIHELMHAIGFFHEQNRDDRDQYVKINWNNIEMDWRKQYYTSTQQGYNAKLIGKYDFESVMHYSRYAGSTNGLSMSAIREPVNENNNKMGNRYGATTEDVWKINHLYSCSAKPITTMKPSRHTTTGWPTNECKDILLHCHEPHMIIQCHTNEYLATVCQKTCGYCSQSTTTTRWPGPVKYTTTRRSTTLCRDIWIEYCRDANTISQCYTSVFVARQCQKSCGHCTPYYSDTSNCYDILPNCHQYLHLCNSVDYIDDSCQRSCGHCGGSGDVNEHSLNDQP